MPLIQWASQDLSTKRITATGIASAEALGSDKVSLSVKPNGIASAEAFGAARVSLGVVAVGIATGQAFGSDKVSLGVAVTGIASAAAFGSASLASGIAATGIASSQAFGVSKVSLRVSPTGFTSSALGNDAVALVLRAVGIASAEAFGNSTVSNSGTLGISPVAISSGEAFGIASVTGGIVAQPDRGGGWIFTSWGNAQRERPTNLETQDAQAAASEASSGGVRRSLVAGDTANSRDDHDFAIERGSLVSDGAEHREETQQGGDLGFSASNGANPRGTADAEAIRNFAAAALYRSGATGTPSFQVSIEAPDSRQSGDSAIFTVVSAPRAKPATALDMTIDILMEMQWRQDSPRRYAANRRK